MVVRLHSYSGHVFNLTDLKTSVTTGMYMDTHWIGFGNRWLKELIIILELDKKEKYSFFFTSAHGTYTQLCCWSEPRQQTTASLPTQAVF